jgi:uncharacterized protein YeeX (DUF496 family)
MSEETIKLFDLGCLVNLKIGYWSARKMVSRADLISVKLDPDALPKDLVNYGRKLLVSKNEIQTISKVEQRARSYLAKYSAPFEAANCFFVPNKMIADLEHNLKCFKKDFFDVVDSFIVRFAELKEEVKKQHPEFFEKCLRQFYPHTAESLRSKFYFEWHMFTISNINSMQQTSSEEIEFKREKLQQEANNFAEQYIKTMRKEVVDFCTLMECRVNGKPFGEENEAKQLTGRSLSFFRKYISKFRNMNIFGDNEIEKMLTEFQNQYLDLGTTSKSFDSAAMKTAVSLSLSSIRKQASLEEGEGSQFINSLKRRVIL